MIHIIGGGLAGSEAAWQAAELGVEVTIHEMRPVRPTAVHKTDGLAEAYDRTTQLEWMCRVWLTAASVPGLSPTLLTREQVAEAGERLRGYGQRRKREE